MPDRAAVGALQRETEPLRTLNSAWCPAGDSLHAQMLHAANTCHAESLLQRKYGAQIRLRSSDYYTSHR